MNLSKDILLRFKITFRTGQHGPKNIAHGLEIHAMLPSSRNCTNGIYWRPEHRKLSKTNVVYGCSIQYVKSYTRNPDNTLCNC